MSLRAPSAVIILAGFLTGVAHANAHQPLLQDGSYEVRFRLELPHVENWAVNKIKTICIANAEKMRVARLPVLSDNNPLARCPARNVEQDGATLRFDIICEGRDGAKGKAVYTLLPLEFKGRIAMVMGGKNMTMTEVQVGHRVGNCDWVGPPHD